MRNIATKYIEAAHPIARAAHESRLRALAGWASQMGLATLPSDKNTRMRKAVIVNGQYFQSASAAGAALGIHEYLIRLACNGHKTKRFVARFARAS